MSGQKLGDVVVGDPDVFEHSDLNLIQVVHGSLQGDVMANIKLNVALRLLNCIQVS